MRTVSFQSVLNGTASLLGIGSARSQLGGDRAVMLCEYINQRVKEGWQFDWFPEWCPVEQRYYRDGYAAGAFYVALDQVYDPGSQLYYQALQDQAAATQAPATYDAATDVWTENSACWAQLKDAYSGGLWTTGTAYAVGDQVRDPLTNKFYQCISAHTSSGTLDTTQFSLLVAFQRYIAYEQLNQTPIGQVPRDGITYRDPRVWPDRPGPLLFHVIQAGYLILPVQPAWVTIPQNRTPDTAWVKFRMRAPTFTTTAWVSGTAYDIGALVYYQGECYRSAIGNNDQPIDGVTNWIGIEFPEILASFVKRAAAADAMRDQKQYDKADDLLGQAFQELGDVRDREIGAQGENDTCEVVTYGT